AAAKVVPTLKKLLAISSFDVNVGPSQSDGEEEPTLRPSVVKFEAVPVGSYGLGTATESSDIDVLVVGNISPSTFWSLFRLLLHKYISKQKESVEDGLPAIKLKRFVKEAAVPMMELMVGDMPVDLQYCSAPGVLER
ncbi:MAG TPA: nucleotidyltransferase domain-containing protein, partial [Chlamydiales bacterium]|nr:nucleotidyltransferase domain-containing protein [Chlamydiales bacterium]